MRYKQLIPIIEELQPKTVLEIGTHKAVRPLEWSKVCKFTYYGFDVFEGGTEGLFKKELNGKGFSSLSEAQKRLTSAGIEHALHKGLTSDTLPGFVESGIKIDFAFIDGGHSEETIKSDFEHVLKVMNKGGVIVFDDYYLPPRKGFGCNFMLTNPEAKLIPIGDKSDKTAIYMVRYDV